MKKKGVTIAIIILSISLVVLGSYNILDKNKKQKEIKTKKLVATIIKKDKEKMTVQDKNNIIYTFNNDKEMGNNGENIVIEYSGLLNKSLEKQNSLIINCINEDDDKNKNGIRDNYEDNGIFSDYYKLAYDDLQTMTLDEKIGQLLLVRYPDSNQKEILKENKFAGYIFYEKDFKNKNKDDVLKMTQDLQDSSKIPILTAVDEEGGSVVRVSSNKSLAKEKFASPSQLYKAGGFTSIKNDTIAKSKLLNSLGINLNLAPVVDITNSEDNYMFERTLQEDAEVTSEFAEVVIKASKNTGVSYTLKHFPGYANNDDTHDGVVNDERELDLLKKNDFLPFEAGIKALAETILVNHNVMKKIDEDNPASLSATIHNILRNDLGFTGIIMTDDMAMKAVKDIDNKIVKALLAGNDLVLVSDYNAAIKEIKEGLEKGIISEELINKLAFRVIAWKYYKGLMFMRQK